ncbi:kelch-like protein 12 [Tiliqua scincoides]|uniref:kelch-like protein 12 n=1 Tax=Tiliqua scincoides TaxID=71010 RepID=UPI0034621697
MSSNHKKRQPAKLTPRPLGLRQGLAEMYREEMLCDATLIVDGQRFPCHRALLAAISPYFRDVFIHTWKESNGGEVLLQGIAPSVIQSILKYIYTEEIALTPEQAPHIFAGACQLQIIPVQDTCCRFLMKNLSIQNCFGMYSLACTHQSQPLLRATIQFLTLSFRLVSEEEDFLKLDSNTLVTLISSDDLMVASELKVYQAIRRWVKCQPRQRGPLLGELMRHVRFPLFSAEEQAELQKDLKLWGDLKLKWQEVDGDERLRLAKGLRGGMYKPHILCIDTQLSDYQEMETEEAHMSCYEPQAGNWEKLPGLPFLTHACCTAAGDKVYISGGVCRNSYSSSVYEFSAFKGHWVQLPSMSVPRAAHGFLFWDRMLYAMGGWQKFQSFLRSAESFDLETGKWAAIPKLPFALSHPAASVFRNKLYLLGGATGISSHWLFHRGLLIYEISSSTWTQVPLPAGFYAAGAVALDNGICVFGGYMEKKFRDWVEGTLSPENRYSTRKCFFVNEAGTVTHATSRVTNGPSIPKLPRGIANAGVVWCGKRIYILGGEDLTQRYKAIYHWSPGEPRWHRMATDIPMSREGISRFGCATLMRPKPHILQLFQRTSRVIVAVVSI